MRKLKPFWKRSVFLGLAVIPSGLFSYLTSLLFSSENRIEAAAVSWLIGFFAVFTALVAKRVNFSSSRRRGLPFVLLILVLPFLLVLFHVSENDSGALLISFLLLATSLSFDDLLSNHREFKYWIYRLWLALLTIGWWVIFSQWETRYSEEEFFVLIQVMVLLAWWLVLWIEYRSYLRWFKNDLIDVHTNDSQGGLNQTKVVMSLFVVSLILVGFFLFSYQKSFFPTEAPSFDGVTVQQPFLCGNTKSSETPVQGEKIFKLMINQVTSQGGKSPTEYGFLALATGEPIWQQAFRTSLLEEVAQAKFTGPANSVKFIQYEAAYRVYYFSKIKEAFPNLFSQREEQMIRDWFQAINRRALTVELVDWAYASAFHYWPKGPYENQEIGMGLLSLMEANKLSSQALSLRNQQYLDANKRGWDVRFRVTDDAIAYQPEWIDNAYFQSFYFGVPDPDFVRLSFDWLLLQSLPDGAPLTYNQAGEVAFADIAYLGALWLQDPTLMWLSLRSLTYRTNHQLVLTVRPGMERSSTLQEISSPTQASCLLFGNSGLPTQVGPLAPDKIVFRDGWEEDSSYLLLNLRFTGWHRYKAPNTVVLYYQAGPLIVEQTRQSPFSWLPRGRSLFRDKRIPRENLNGIVVERSGLDNILFNLTGIGGRWAQDPPFYARVESFQPGSEMDYSHTVIDNWSGWHQDRYIYFYHGGPVIIRDKAIGPKSESAMVWHVYGEGSSENGRIKLRSTTQGFSKPSELAILPIRQGDINIESEGVEQITGQIFPEWKVWFSPNMEGNLDAVTVLLSGDWVGSRLELIDYQGSKAIRIVALSGEEIIQPFQ